MQQLEEFRLYYNHTIHPELLRMERNRQRLLLLLFFSFFLLGGLLVFELSLKILPLTLSLMIPIGFYSAYLLYKIQKFRSTFKPNVINLILDFMDNANNYEKLVYNSTRCIPRERFLASQLFYTDAPYYKGEDYIQGKIGDLAFELCELSVKEFSKVRNRLNYVFKGVFLQAVLSKPLRGTIIILPRAFQQYLSSTIKAFTRNGGQPVVKEIRNIQFAKHFMTYATPDALVHHILPPEMQELIVNYRRQAAKDIYISFVNRSIFIGITEPKDILEPYIFRSNVSFELVCEFFEEIRLLLSIVAYFDKYH